jgi:hypothetical protein
VHSEIALRFQVFDHHVGEVVNVDDDVDYPERSQPFERDFQKSASRDFYERFRTAVGQWA